VNAQPFVGPPTSLITPREPHRAAVITRRGGKGGYLFSPKKRGGRACIRVYGYSPFFFPGGLPSGGKRGGGLYLSPPLRGVKKRVQLAADVENEAVPTRSGK